MSNIEVKTTSTFNIQYSSFDISLGYQGRSAKYTSAVSKAGF